MSILRGDNPSFWEGIIISLLPLVLTTIVFAVVFFPSLEPEWRKPWVFMVWAVGFFTAGYVLRAFQYRLDKNKGGG